MLIPIGHERSSARRWPVVTLALIIINISVFLATHGTIEEQSSQLGEVKAHLLMLAAMHPGLNLPPDAQQFVESFRAHNPGLWKQIQHPNRDIADAWDARVRMMEDTQELQEEMDQLTTKYAQLAATSLTEQYAFVPLHPRPFTYVTANFLHGGWLHLIGNLWFLWLAGFILEDSWGRILYTLFYFVSGAAALQVHAWLNPGSMTPALGASGAVAALMGAFLVRFPKIRIEMAWLVGLLYLRVYRFKAPAYWLLPIWLLMEVFYGSLFGQVTGVAHWAHVGGFLFGVVAAGAVHYSGLESRIDKAIEGETTLESSPAIVHASELMDRNQVDQAIAALQQHIAEDPNSIDACMLLQQAYSRKEDLPAYHEITAKVCSLHLKAHQPDAAWENYEELIRSGGGMIPVALWFELCRVAEQQQNFERALGEYQSLAAAYPSERQSLSAQLAAARICLKRLNRPQEALKFYEAAAASRIPHLDWEAAIEAGIREAKAALTPASAVGTHA